MSAICMLFWICINTDFAFHHFTRREALHVKQRTNLDAVTSSYEFIGRYFFPFGVLVFLAVTSRHFRAESLYKLLLMGYSLQDVLFFYLQRMIKFGVESVIGVIRIEVFHYWGCSLTHVV